MTNASFFILGLILGLGIHILLLKVQRVDGVFIVDDRDSETTQWTLRMNSEDPTKMIKNKKMIHMKVEELKEES
jgi:hypothetical protein